MRRMLNLSLIKLDAEAWPPPCPTTRVCHRIAPPLVPSRVAVTFGRLERPRSAWSAYHWRISGNWPAGIFSGAEDPAEEDPAEEEAEEAEEAAAGAEAEVEAEAAAAAVLEVEELEVGSTCLQRMLGQAARPRFLLPVFQRTSPRKRDY